MNGKKAKRARRDARVACKTLSITNERDLAQVNNKGSLELEIKTFRYVYKTEKKRVRYEN